MSNHPGKNDNNRGKIRLVFNNDLKYLSPIFFNNYYIVACAA